MCAPIVFRAAQSLSREDLAGGMPQKRAALRAGGVGEDCGLGWWAPAAPGAPPAKPIAVRTFLQPRPAFFVDAVVAQIDHSPTATNVSIGFEIGRFIVEPTRANVAPAACRPSR